MAINDKYALSSESRVFIRQTPDCCPSDYSYHSCMRLDGIEENLGEISSGYCPSDSKVGEFVEVVQIKSAPERATSSLVGRIPATYESILYKLKKRGCKFDLQLHFGKCVNPTNFDTFDFSIVLEDVLITSYSTDALGALTPDENILINETVALSIGSFYYLRKLSMSNLMQKNTTLFSGYEGAHLITCEQPGCFSCCEADCAIYALLLHTATNIFHVFASKDGGETWVQSNTGVIAEPNQIPVAFNLTCYDKRIYLTNVEITTPAADYGVVYSASIDAIFTGTAVWIKEWEIIDSVTTRPKTPVVFFQGEPYGVVGRDGAVPALPFKRVIRYYFDGTNTFDVVYDPNRYNPSDNPGDDALFQYNDEVMLVGVNYQINGIGYIGYTYDGYTWEESEIIVNGVPITGVTGTTPYPLSKTNWLVATSKTALAGTGTTDIYCTYDAGLTWHFVSRAELGVISSFVNNNIAYGTRSFGGVRTLHRSYNGGIDWVKLPDNDSNVTYDLTVSPNTGLLRVRPAATCQNDPNYVLAIGQNGIFKFSV